MNTIKKNNEKKTTQKLPMTGKKELMSLSDRFGLVVYFSKPNKALYLEIVHQLAQKADLDIPSDELDIKAEAFALSKGSR